MSSLNKVLLIGRLGKDPEQRFMPDGGAVSNVTLATSETWKDKAGEKQEKTEWHRLVFFGKLAEISGEYLKKGSLIYVEGRIQTRKWQDKDGQDRYSTEIVGDRMQMLGPKPSAADPGEDDERDRKRKPEPKTGGKFDDFESDIPF